MKLYTAIYFILIFIIICTDYLLYKKRKTVSNYTHIFSAIIFVVFYTFLKIFSEQITDYRFLIVVMWVNFLFIALYISKLIYIFVLIISNKFNWEKTTKNYLLYTLLILFNATLLYSSFVTPNQIDISSHTIKFESLPRSFNNFKIVQISDIHLGSRVNGIEFYKTVVQKVNSLNPDIVVFTGDMVNNFADETAGYDKVFKQIKAKYGKFAILGNHDYGDYSEWKTESDKTTNFNLIKSKIRSFGFILLLNEHISLKKGNDRIQIIGVENYHNKAYKNHADLNSAIKGIQNSDFKLLLSHNPNHWQDVILKSPHKIDITLSGHTHAGQVGIQFGSSVYSPVWFLYKFYQGIYFENGMYLHVNRGLGYIGLPIMIGINPEVSIINLQTSKPELKK